MAPCRSNLRPLRRIFHIVEHDQAYEGYAGPASPFPRAPHLIASGPISLLVILGTAAFGPPMLFATSSAAEAALGAAIMAVAVMPGIAFFFATADWLAEIRNRKYWSSIGGEVDVHIASSVVRAPKPSDNSHRPRATLRPFGFCRFPVARSVDQIRAGPSSKGWPPMPRPAAPCRSR
jgi:hypothetical protein